MTTTPTELWTFEMAEDKTDPRCKKCRHLKSWHDKDGCNEGYCECPRHEAEGKGVR